VSETEAGATLASGQVRGNDFKQSARVDVTPAVFEL
jgi:hypothetical protein